jgi:hypothetical protein
MKRHLPAIAAILGGLLLLIPLGASGGKNTKPTDSVSSAFDAYETLWRTAQGSLADRLDSGEIASESAASDWFGEANKQARAVAFKPLLDAEYSVFGEDKWTAEKQAETIRGYVR